MMKRYVYKIQWLIDRKDVFTIKFKHLMDLIGARLLDNILFRDDDYKILDDYDGFLMYPYEVADSKTVKDVRKILKKNNKITFVELLRR